MREKQSLTLGTRRNGFASRIFLKSGFHRLTPLSSLVVGQTPIVIKGEKLDITSATNDRLHRIS